MTCVCAVFARIRPLRKSPQYSLVILEWKMTVSADLRKTSSKNAQTNVKILAREIPYSGPLTSFKIFLVGLRRGPLAPEKAQPRSSVARAARDKGVPAMSRRPPKGHPKRGIRPKNH